MPGKAGLQVSLLGDSSALKWKADKGNLRIALPAALPGKYAYVFKLAGYER